MFDMVAFLVLTYLLSAVPFGLVVTTLLGGDVDIRAAGSGNIGATNVARVYGWRLAGPVLVADLLKGLAPVAIGGWMWPTAGLTWQAVIGMTAFVGHCFPVYLELRGGKGVATAGGAMLAIAPGPTLLGFLVWVGILAATGRSSIAALGATLSMFGFTGWLVPAALPIVAVLAAAIVYTHLANIRRLVSGKETAVIRPVRWGRTHVESPTAEEVLAQGPGGQDTSRMEWGEQIEDPMGE